jgi:AmiR/NasT family two-component response regulator
MSVEDDVRASVDASVMQQLAAAELENDQLRTALDVRTVIGQAQGILMERLRMDADAAFEYLKRVSSHSNRKVSEIAEEIARTRVLPMSTTDHTTGGGRSA